MNISKYKNFIWDWNGTLLNDVSYCVSSMNTLLKERGMPQLTLNKYQDIFTFPVETYYKKLGFDFSVESFDKIGHEFMKLYFRDLHTCSLFPDVVSVLARLKKMGKQQFILSAMEHDSLKKELKNKGIIDYFQAVYGIDNHLAAGKIDRAKQMIEKYDIDVKQSVVIGDTLHDKEVAMALGCDIIFVAKGHISLSRLQESNSKVIMDFKELFD